VPRAFPSGHLPLVVRELGSSRLPMLRVGQVVVVVGGRGGFTHAPVDTHRLAGLRQRLHFDGDNERAVPVPQLVLVHPHRRRFGRQVPRPHTVNAVPPARSLGSGRTPGVSGPSVLCASTTRSPSRTSDHGFSRRQRWLVRPLTLRSALPRLHW